MFVRLAYDWLDYALGEGARVDLLAAWDWPSQPNTGWVDDGFGPFEKPSAPAFSVHAEIRALS